MYAEADVDDQARAFIRRDSRALIRRRYGIAGAAFVEIGRGTGAELDWNYAMIPAVTERDPTLQSCARWPLPSSMTGSDQHR